jgi:hypothetical protein
MVKKKQKQINLEQLMDRHLQKITSVIPGVMDCKLPISAPERYFSVKAAANSPFSSVKPKMKLVNFIV